MSLSRGLTGLARNSLGVTRHRTIPPSLRGLGVGSSRAFTDTTAMGATDVVQEKSEATGETQEGWLFVDSVFPVKVATWDLRYYIGQFREKALLDNVKSLVSSVDTNSFEVLSVEPQVKDGGVFVKFRYKGGPDNHAVLDSILQDLKQVSAKSGVPSWAGRRKGDIWLVKGNPWREDLNRFASPIVKISFEGPDVHEETLYEILRPYGRIIDLSAPTPVPAGMLRSTSVTFRHIRSAAAARNTVHGLVVRSSFSGSVTRLQTSYQLPLQAHLIRDYIASHPKIFLPILIFLLGTLTYTIFDPVRVLMVEGKLNDWFDYRQFRVYQWVKENTWERFSLTSTSESEHSSGFPMHGAWKERQDAEKALVNYLSDIPTTVAFIHGPQGSGKSRLLASVLKDSNRKTLTIDVAELSKVTSEMALVTGLANQTGYWPVFSFLNSLNTLIDLASVGLIGQKTGLSSSLSDQLKQILEVVGTSLTHVNTSYRERRERERRHQRSDDVSKADSARISDRIKQGTWHDGRIDAVSGNGVISELGMGDEWLGEKAAGEPFLSFVSSVGGAPLDANNHGDDVEAKSRLRSLEELQAIESMPLVIIKNFDSKGLGFRREELLNVLAQWAATLAENKIAHVVVVSNNRENSKRLAKAIPTKPLTFVSLSDADSTSALSFVKQKLSNSDLGVKFNKTQTALVERLGGRASDLESLIHKVRSGQSIENAVEDIVTRGASELRKSAFGDDTDDAKSLPWAREQAWFLMKQLAKRPELPYQDVLNEFPFKGDESALRSMEHAEFISIGTVNGRPSTIKPGKPIYRYVFDRLLHDSIFEATQDIAYNNSLIKFNEGIIQKCEEEIVVLKDVDAATSVWWGSRAAVDNRREYLLGKMRVAGNKVETADRQNTNLKKVLAKGG